MQIPTKTRGKGIADHNDEGKSSKEKKKPEIIPLFSRIMTGFLLGAI